MVETRLRTPIDLTIVLPAFNEAETVETSYRRISEVLDRTGLDYEFLFIDDGSSDSTWQATCELRRKNPRRVRGLRHRSNSGKAAALANGFTHSAGRLIVTCDADLQYEPEDVLRVINKAHEGYDVVSAKKTMRTDGVSRKLASRFFNFFVRRNMGVPLHDMNAGLKAYSRDAALELVKYGYGELHRFFVVILYKKGYSVTEIPVASLPRESGKSKYGGERFLRGALDFLTVFFLSGYVERPLHLFGGLGIALGAMGTSLLAGLVVAQMLLLSAATAVPLLAVAVLLILTGTQLLATGLMAEMIGNLERGPMNRAKIGEVAGVERRTRVLPPEDLLVERRDCGQTVRRGTGDRSVSNETISEADGIRARLRTPQTGKTRSIVLPETTVRVLEEHRRGQPKTASAPWPCV